jgi:chloramphenicol 3-O-phosphotransferase/ADP-ribose pyrophosphatase YjhB (NUDIX family)
MLSDGRILLARQEEDGAWVLPGGPLLDSDESVEDAIMRALAERFGIESGMPDFLDTVYERRPDEVIVHNLFTLAPPDTAIPHGTDLRWAALDALHEAGLPDWLAEALPALLQGEEPPGPAIEWGLLEGETGRTVSPVGGRAAPVIIVTGPAGAGKSTVARALCGRFARAAHIDVDLLRWRMIVSGYVRPEAAYGADTEAEEAWRQLALRARNAAALARNFAVDGFTAVIDDVLERCEELDMYLAELDGLDVAFVTLLPDAASLRARDEGREPEQRMGERSEELRRIITVNGETRGLRLDTSRITVDETVDTLLEQMDGAWVAIGGSLE